MGATEILFKFLGDNTSLKKSTKESESDLDGFKGKMTSYAGSVTTDAKKAGKGILQGFGIGSASIIAIGGDFIKAALVGEKSSAQLKNAVEKTGTSFKSLETPLASLATKFAGFGYQNDELEGALASLTTATGDPKKAMADMGVVADLAAAKNLSLSSASKIVSKVLNGNVGSLSRYGIATKDAAGNTLTASGAMKALQDKFGGSAQAQADTYAGKIKGFKAQFDNLKESIGNKLLPVFSDLASAVSNTVNWFSKHEAVAYTLGGAVSVLTAALVANKVAGLAASVQTGISTIATGAQAVAAGVATAATTAWSVAVGAFNVVMDANPIMLVVAAIAALVAGVIYAYNHFTWFKAIVDTVWSGIKAGISDVWAMVTKVLGAISDAFVTAWSGITGAISWAWGLIKGVVQGGINDVVSIVGTITSLVTSAASGAWDMLKSGFKTAINWIIDGVNALPKAINGILSHIPGLSSIAIPLIPHLAKGGIVDKPTVALIGEAGKEVVFPTNNPQRGYDMLSKAGVPPPAGQPTGRGVHQYINVQAFDPRQAARSAMSEGVWAWKTSGV